MSILQFVDVSTTNATMFGAWLRENRLKEGLTLEGLAFRAKASKQYLSVLERASDHPLTGKPVTPKAELVERLAEALHANVNDGLAAAGYAPKANGSTSIQITDDVRVILDQHDLSAEDEEEYERALSIAVEMAKRRIADKKG